MDVFSTFPNAVIHKVWSLGKLERNTETGATFNEGSYKDVIVDEVTNGATDRSPSADYIDSDTLLYARPSQMPTLNAATLTAGYLWYNSEDDQYYKIVEVGIGKNQELGIVEHIEFLIQPTEVLDED